MRIRDQLLIIYYILTSHARKWLETCDRPERGVESQTFQTIRWVLNRSFHSSKIIFHRQYNKNLQIFTLSKTKKCWEFYGNSHQWESQLETKFNYQLTRMFSNENECVHEKIYRLLTHKQSCRCCCCLSSSSLILFLFFLPANFFLKFSLLFLVCIDRMFEYILTKYKIYPKDISVYFLHGSVLYSWDLQVRLRRLVRCKTMRVVFCIGWSQQTENIYLGCCVGSLVQCVRCVNYENRS